MGPVLAKLAVWSTTRPWVVLLVAAILTGPAAWVASGLGVSTSRTALVSEDNPHWRRYMAFAHAFGIPEDLVVVVKGEDPKALHAFADRVAETLRTDPEVVSAVFHKLDLSYFESRAPLFVGTDVLDRIESFAHSEAFARLRAVDDPAVRMAALAELVERASNELGPSELAESATSVSGILSTRLRVIFEALESYALSARRPPVELIPRETAVQAILDADHRTGLDADGYLTARDGKAGVLFVRPTYTRDEMKVVVPFVERVRKACRDAEREVPGVRFGLTGIPASEVDELSALRRDTKLTTVIALVGVIILFLAYFRALRLLLLSLVPILLGIVWTAAFVRIAFGYVNLMSSVFLVVLIGMGVDFSVHLAARFLEERRRGRSGVCSTRTAVIGAGRGVVTSAVTSAGAFFAVGWCGFKGIEQLGFAAAFGLVATLVFTLTVFAALLALWGRHLPDAQSPSLGMGGWVRTVLQGRRAVLWGAALVSGPLLVWGLRTPFDFSLLNLLPEHAESAVLMGEMLEDRNLSANAVAASVDSVEEARDLAARFRALPSVHGVISAATFLPPEQDARLSRLRAIDDTLRRTADTARRAAFPRVGLPDSMARLAGALERASELAFAANETVVVNALEAALGHVETVREQLEGPQAAAARAGVVAFTRQLAKRVDDLAGRVGRAVELGPLAPDDLPVGLARRFVSSEGRLAVYAVPKASIWDREALGAFIDDVRSIAPNVTGFPETYYENATLIREGFVRAAVYAAVAVFFLLLLDFGRFRYVAFAVIPVVLGAAWMLGAMYLLNIPYNLANIVGLPLIIGVGIDNGVHVLHRYRRDRSVQLAAVQTGGAVVLSSLTTMIGFGSLAFASHRGYASLGQLLFLGVGACLFTAVTVLPAALATADARERA